MKVILHKLFPYAPYLNEYIGFEKEVGESDEEALEAIEHLRELAERSHREKYPHLYQEPTTEIAQDQPPQPISNEDKKRATIQSHIKTVQECKTLNNLKIFDKLVERTNDPELTYAYQEKFIELKDLQ